jgi:hypothetical protein
VRDTDNTMDLSAFRHRLAALLGNDPDARPFVCDGDPYRCQAFVVGINPASGLPFWPFWSDATGFDRTAWFAAYLAARRDQPLKPGKRFRPAISPTRRTIGWLVEAAAPVAVLETNLYVRPTPAATDLTTADRHTAPFEFLVAELKPRVLLLHGRETAERFDALYGTRLSPQFSQVLVNGHQVFAAAVPHLSRGVSREKAAVLGRELRDACQPAA